MTLLHEPDALRTLTDTEGLAADWARTRLVLIEPEHDAGLPREFSLFAPFLVFAEDGLERVIAVLQQSPDLASIGVLEALELGLCPADPLPLIAALQQAIQEDGSDSDLLFATALARLGVTDARALGAAAAATSMDRDWLLPSVALNAAENMGSTANVVQEIAAALRAAEEQRPGAIELCLAELGVPFRGYWDTPEESLHDVAAVLGVDVPVIATRKGSRKRKAQHTVRALLEGRSDAASALVRALADADMELATFLIYSAGWLALFEPTDPVLDAVHRHGGLNAMRLGNARRALGEHHLPLIKGALENHLENAAILANALPGQPLAEEILAHMVHTDSHNPVDVFLGVRACWTIPGAVPKLLASPETLWLGLTFAEWIPTVEVLEALLGAEVPATPEWIRIYAEALAAMGDPAAAEVLRALIQQDPEATTHARQLAESILHQPLV